jgi:hypothetical protein
MKVSLVILFLLVSVGAAAQEEPPDYSREKLIEIFANVPEREDVEPRIRHSIGALDFRAFGMRWRVGYLPFFAPLPGSQPWIHKERWPDAFSLTGTEFASPPRTWRQTRNMSAELRRIERKLKEKQKVKVTPE